MSSPISAGAVAPNVGIVHNQRTSDPDELFQADILYDRYYQASKWLAAAVAFIAVMVLVGWMWDIRWLAGISSDFARIRVSTAVGLLFLAGALLLLNPRIPMADRSGMCRRYGISLSLAMGACVLGLLTLLSYAMTEGGEKVHPEWMAPATAICFTLLGGAIGCSMARDAGQYVSQSLTAGVIFISTLVLLGYLFSKQSLYALPPHSAMGLHTAVSFVLLALSLLCLWPDRGLMKPAAAETAGGMMLQRMVPLVVGMIIAIGWIRLMGEAAGLYNNQFGLNVVVGLSLVGFGAILWALAGVLNRIDAARGLSKRRMQRAVTQLRASD